MMSAFALSCSKKGPLILEYSRITKAIAFSMEDMGHSNPPFSMNKEYGLDSPVSIWI